MGVLQTDMKSLTKLLQQFSLAKVTRTKKAGNEAGKTGNSRDSPRFPRKLGFQSWDNWKTQKAGKAGNGIH